MTVHPSYLLRLPDAEAKAREYQRFVDDLKIAADLLRKIGTGRLNSGSPAAANSCEIQRRN